jgi:hypothetical protein
MTTGNPCQDCGYRITWAEQRRQYARAIQRYGVSSEAAKKLMPRCEKCLTETFRAPVAPKLPVFLTLFLLPFFLY